MIPFVATGLTFLRNFKLPCMYIALGAGIVAAGGSWWITRAVYQRATLKAELNLSKFEAKLASSAAEGQKQAREQLQTAQAEMDTWRQGIENQLAAIPSAVQKKLSGDIRILRESIHAPEFNCLREPLPDSYLGVLRRPADSVPARDHPNPSPSGPSR